MKLVLWFAAVAIVVTLVLAGINADPQREAARKQECTAALMSDVGHSTVAYADKQAYDKEVREKCDGFEMDGRPLGR